MRLVYDVSHDQVYYSHDSRENSQKRPKMAKNVIFENLKSPISAVIGATIKVKGSIVAD